MPNEVMQNTKSFIDNASNDDERNSPPKKGHGYTGAGYGGGRDQTRALPGKREQDLNTDFKASLDGSESHADTPQGAPYPSSPGAKGGFAKKVGYGEL